MVNPRTAAIGGQAAFVIIKTAVEFFKIHEAEETQREYIRAKRNVLVTALNNERDFLLDYFEKRFGRTPRYVGGILQATSSRGGQREHQ